MSQPSVYLLNQAPCLLSRIIHTFAWISLEGNLSVPATLLSGVGLPVFEADTLALLSTSVKVVDINAIHLQKEIPTDTGRQESGNRLSDFMHSSITPFRLSCIVRMSIRNHPFGSVAKIWLFNGGLSSPCHPRVIWHLRYLTE